MTEHKPFPPVFATNNPQTGETVADEVNRMMKGLREELAQSPHLALATAYINPQGFALIAAEVEQAPRVRILLGAEPDEPLQRLIESGEGVSFEQVALDYENGLKRERDLVGFDAQSDAAARKLVAWLRFAEAGEPPRVEVRRFTRGFLHGKAFVAEHPKMPAVLAGSSNLTYAGLTLNRELNLGYPSGTYTELVVDWFNQLWQESEPFDLAAMYEARWNEHAPWVVFLRMLYELYGLGNSSGEERIQLPVTEFQRDGIARSMRILEELGGVLVCDEVGLGKTFIAGEVIRKVSQENRQKVLVVVPASLLNSTWDPFLRKYDFTRRVELVTYDDLRIGTKREVQNLDDYAMVVVDEAHNLRNPNTLRAEAVMELLWGGHPKKVMLLTATPVNNSLKDLHTLVNYFVRNDAQFISDGIPSIDEYIRRAQALDPDTLSPEHLFDLMDKVAVRRTRRFIKREYANDFITNNRGELVPIEFPIPEIERLTYDLDLDSNDIVSRVLHALAVSDDESLVIRAGVNRDPSRLSLARYAPSVYLKNNDIDRLQITNVGLLRSGLLKRLESSTAALIATIERLITSHEAFLEGIAAGYVITGDSLSGYVNSDSDDLQEFLTDLDEVDPDEIRDIEEFEGAALKRDVELDVALLRDLLKLARKRQQQGPDAKVTELLAHLSKLAEQAERPDKNRLSAEDRRKVIIFSTYADTVEDLHKRITDAIDKAPKNSSLASFKKRIAPAVFGAQGSSAQTERADILAGFAPMTAGEVSEDGEPKSKNLYDILVATDVLAEGVNLQQAGQMVSFDLPWNPMRLVQRHGRIDRIGSPHKHVLIGCFFPAENLDELLQLESTLQRKIAYANAAIGTGTVIPGQISDPNREVLFKDNVQDIKKIHAEDASLLLEAGGSGALSGEEYRRRLGRAMQGTYPKEDVLNLPYGSGSGFVSTKVRQSGYVFCVKVGTHKTPWFRFVAAHDSTWRPLDKADGVPWIDDDTLTCLIAADPGEREEIQMMPEAALTNVFGAWARARADVHFEWSKLTDWANLEPQIPKALRVAIEVVFQHGHCLPPEAQQDLIARLNGRWENSVVRAVRDIIRDENSTDTEKVLMLQRFVKDSGLPLPVKPEPLPPVRIDDIRVVCWMAVTSTKAES
jgi:superfamily II DNA or RNA helicase